MVSLQASINCSEYFSTPNGTTEKEKVAPEIIDFDLAKCN